MNLLYPKGETFLWMSSRIRRPIKARWVTAHSKLLSILSALWHQAWMGIERRLNVNKPNHGFVIWAWKLKGSPPNLHYIFFLKPLLFIHLRLDVIYPVLEISAVGCMPSLEYKKNRWQVVCGAQSAKKIFLKTSTQLALYRNWFGAYSSWTTDLIVSSSMYIFFLYEATEGSVLLMGEKLADKTS